jgi:hypothetical protein
VEAIIKLQTPQPSMGAEGGGHGCACAADATKEATWEDAHEVCMGAAVTSQDLRSQT